MLMFYGLIYIKHTSVKFYCFEKAVGNYGGPGLKSVNIIFFLLHTSDRNFINLCVTLRKTNVFIKSKIYDHGKIITQFHFN